MSSNIWTQLLVQLSYGAWDRTRMDWLKTWEIAVLLFLSKPSQGPLENHRELSKSIHSFHPKNHTFSNRTLVLTHTRSPVLFFLRRSSVVDKRVGFQRFQHFHCTILAGNSSAKKICSPFSLLTFNAQATLESQLDIIRIIHSRKTFLKKELVAFCQL